ARNDFSASLGAPSARSASPARYARRGASASLAPGVAASSSTLAYSPAWNDFVASSSGLPLVPRTDRRAGRMRRRAVMIISSCMFERSRALPGGGRARTGPGELRPDPGFASPRGELSDPGEVRHHDFGEVGARDLGGHERFGAEGATDVGLLRERA